MKSRPANLLLLALAIAVLCILSYSAGFKRAASRQPETTAAPTMETTSLQPPPAPAPKEVAPPVPKAATPTPPREPAGLRGRIAKFSHEIGQMDAKAVLKSLKELSEQTPGPDRLISQQLLLARFAELDPETALSYADSLKGADKQLGALAIISTWAENAPKTAADYFDANADAFGILAASQGQAAGAIAAAWARRDPDAAFQWASELPEEVRGEAYGQIISQLSVSASDRALGIINAMPPGYERTELLQTLTARWAQDAPRETADWATRIPDATEQSRAVGTLVTSWMQTNPQEASQWVNHLPPGPSRDAAIAAMNQSSAFRRDPQTAVLWASTIQEEKLRNATLQAALNRWMATDPKAAQVWLQSQQAAP